MQSIVKRFAAGLAAACILATPVRSEEEATGAKSAPHVQIEGAKLATEITDREVAREAADLAVGDVVYLWMRVVGAADEVLRVTWRCGDQIYAAELEIGGSPWRTWAKKTLPRAGAWTVTVADMQDNEVYSMKFEVAAAAGVSVR